MSKVILELRGGGLYDAEGAFLITPIVTTKYFEPDIDKDKLVLDLVKQGITPSEIIKLRNNELL